MMKTNARGFTLIELLVVIAIIGILSSVVLASLNSAREKGRDARRIADIKQLQLALELYYDANGSYASTTAGLVGPYIAAIPVDPLTGNPYDYAGLGSGDTCTSYHLGTTLEQDSHSALDGDNDFNSTGAGKCTGGGDGFDGTAAAVYDVRP